MGLTTCTELQCLYKGALYLIFMCPRRHFEEGEGVNCGRRKPQNEGLCELRFLLLKIYSGRAAPVHAMKTWPGGRSVLH